MKLTSRTHRDTGHVTKERVLRNKDKDVLKRESSTEGLGPFTREPVHARVSAHVSATLSRNYHSVSVSVTVNIPVDASEQGVDTGADWCFRKANAVLNTELKGANRALDKLAG